MAGGNDQEPKTITELINTFTSFLLVSIHTILYHRRLYPRTTFLTTRAYSYPVAQSRHPSVCQWITDAVDAVSTQLLRPKDDIFSPTGKGEVGGWVERVVLVIFSEDAEVIERYVFDVSGLPRVPAKEIDTTFVREQSQPTASATKAKGQFVEPDKVHMDLSTQFRATLAQMNNLSKRLTPLPRNCTFSLAIEMADDADPPVGHPQEQDWIAAEPSLQRTAGDKPGVERGGGRLFSSANGMEGALEGGWNDDSSGAASTQRGKDLIGSKTLPVRKVDAGEMVFEMWVEEGKAKKEAVERAKARPSSSAETE